MFKYLFEKEFKQLLRNKFLPRVVVILPFAMVGLFPMIANFDVKDVKLTLIDQDHSSFSKQLTGKLLSSGYFQLAGTTASYTEALHAVEQNESDVVFVIPPDFEKDLVTTQRAEVQIAVNTVNGMRGGLSSAYLMGLVNDYSTEILANRTQPRAQLTQGSCEVVPRYRYNTYLKYSYTMIPAILMMALAMLTGFLPALNIVGEKEDGTIEQMNVTPVNKFQLILSKLIPYWIVGFVVLTICFFVAWLFYGMVSAGGYLLVYVFATVFVLAFSGIGLAISNYASTIQQGMFIMFFFVITFVFLSGLYTPVTSMPEWLQTVSLFSPLRFMIEALRGIFLKGCTFSDLSGHFIALCAFAVFFNSWAVISYRKSSS